MAAALEQIGLYGPIISVKISDSAIRTSASIPLAGNDLQISPTGFSLGFFIGGCKPSVRARAEIRILAGGAIGKPGDYQAS